MASPALPAHAIHASMPRLGLLRSCAGHLVPGRQRRAVQHHELGHTSLPYLREDRTPPARTYQPVRPGPRLPRRLPPSAGVGDAVGLDFPGVDRRLLVVFAGAGQVGEEIGPVGEKLGVESLVKLAHDVLAGMQALVLRPGPAVIAPGQARGAPLVTALPQPAVMLRGWG